MFRFFAGLVIGSGLVYCFLVYPKESKRLVHNTVESVSGVAVSAIHAGAEAADKKLTDKKR